MNWFCRKRKNGDYEFFGGWLAWFDGRLWERHQFPGSWRAVSFEDFFFYLWPVSSLIVLAFICRWIGN